MDRATYANPDEETRRLITVGKFIYPSKQKTVNRGPSSPALRMMKRLRKERSEKFLGES